MVAVKGRVLRSRPYRIALVMCAVFGAGDLLNLVHTGARGAPPAVLLAIWSVLGIVTLAGVPFAWRGSYKALVAVVASQVLSALLSVPRFFIDSVTDWDPFGTGVGVALTAVAVGLLLYSASEEANAHAE